VLAAVLNQDGQQLSATQTHNQALADADHLALLHAIWAAETTPARNQRYRDLLMNALPPGHRAEPGQQAQAASYKAMENAYRERERVFAGVMADRAEWEAATRAQRHLAVAADAELPRRHPGQRFTPLRSAEPPAATDAQRAGLTLTAGQDIPEAGQWTKDLAAGRRIFADKLADRQSQTILSEDPDYGDLGQAFPFWTGRSTGAILQPPKPENRGLACEFR